MLSQHSVLPIQLLTSLFSSNVKTKCGFNADAMLFYVTVARIVPRYEEYILMDTHTHTHTETYFFCTRNGIVSLKNIDPEPYSNYINRNSV